MILSQVSFFLSSRREKRPGIFFFIKNDVKDQGGILWK